MTWPPLACVINASLFKYLGTAATAAILEKRESLRSGLQIRLHLSTVDYFSSCKAPHNPHNGNSKTNHTNSAPQRHTSRLVSGSDPSMK
eukprot:2350576-Amphidinium_carterae.1